MDTSHLSPEQREEFKRQQEELKKHLKSMLEFVEKHSETLFSERGLHDTKDYGWSSKYSIAGNITTEDYDIWFRFFASAKLIRGEADEESEGKPIKYPTKEE